MWEPWIGENYHKKRVLILGESAYPTMSEGKIEYPKNDHSKTVIEYAIQNFDIDCQGFLRAVTRAVCGEEWPSKEKRYAAWQNVAFTNYVPIHVDIGHRSRPTKDHWKQAADEWPLLLSALKPNHVLVLGHVMWDMMPREGWNSKEESYSYDEEEKASLTKLPHPASNGASWGAINLTLASLNPDIPLYEVS